MPTPELINRRRRPEARPDEILAAALEVFGEKGLAGARISDIAARAGVAKGTFYLYFETKDDLVRAVVRGVIEDAIAAMRAAAVGATARAKLEAVIPVFWRFVRSPQFVTVYRLVTAELHQFPELTRFYSREVGGRASALLAELIAEGIAAGEFRAVEPRTAARMLVTLCVKHATWLARPDLFIHLAGQPEEQVLADVQAFFFAALRP